MTFRATLLRQVPAIFDYPRAQQDAPYVDLAAAANADYIVTRDNDLLALTSDHSLIGKQFRQRHPGLKIVNPVAFLAALSPTS